MKLRNEEARKSLNADLFKLKENFLVSLYERQYIYVQIFHTVSFQLIIFNESVLKIHLSTFLTHFFNKLCSCFLFCESKCVPDYKKYISKATLLK